MLRGKDWSCKLTEKTEIRIDFKPAKQESLAVGMRIQCGLDESE
jgi:hypothetical protein